METAGKDCRPEGEENAPRTLGDVLYARPSKSRIDEAEWVALVRRVADADQAALHGVYERAGRIVYTLIVRITANRETAEELTLDVFHDVWRKASGYDPADGTVLGWIMNQARSRAIDRIRFDGRKKRSARDVEDAPDTSFAADPQDIASFNQQRDAVRRALDVLTRDERRSIEAAFFSGLTHAEVATRLDQPLGTVKTRIRSALHKLRQKLADESHER